MVVEKPTCAMKVIDARSTAASTDHDPLVKGLSKSVILRTRSFPQDSWDNNAVLLGKAND